MASSLRFAHSSRRLFALIAALPLSLPAQSVWDGEGLDANWSTAENWDLDTAPLSDAATQLTFAGAANLSPVADGAFILRSLTFDGSASAFSLSGFELSFAGSLVDDPDGSFIANDSTLAQIIANNLALGAFTHVKATSGALLLTGSVSLHSSGATFSAGSGQTLTLEGVVSGDGPVTVGGGGTVILTADNTATGGVLTVEGSTLVLGDGGATGSIGGDLGGDAGTTVVINRSDDFTLVNHLVGESNFTHAGTGEIIFATANSHSGVTSVTGGGTLVIGDDGAAGGSTDFQIHGAGSTLRIATGVTLATDLTVGNGALVEVAGTLSHLAVAADGASITDSTLHVLSGGYLEGSADFSGGYSFYGTSVLRLDTPDAIATSAAFYFEGSSSIVSSTPGAITDGAFYFIGPDPLSLDPVQTIALPGSGVITGGYFSLEGKVSATFSTTATLSGPVDFDLYDSALLTVSAAGAIDGTAVVVDGEDGVYLSLNDTATVLIDADDALIATSLTITDGARFILNGHDVTLENLAAFDGLIVNNSATPSTLDLTPCGCGPSFVVGDVFADSDPDYVGTVGSLSLNLDGVGDVLLIGVQRHTGPTTVAGLTLALYGGIDDDDAIRSLASSPLTVRDGGVLAGNGNVNTVAVEDGGGLSPGHHFMQPVSLLETGTISLSGDTFLNIDLLDADSGGVAGSDWDLLVVDGTFTFSATPTDTFTVFLRSGDEGLTELLAGNFDPNASYSFTILQATGGIVGFDTANASVISSAFANAFDGEWTLRTEGGGEYLMLEYTPIPEPAACAALGALAALAVAIRRRRAA